MSDATKSRRNALLAMLPATDYARLSPRLDLVYLSRDQSIYEPDMAQSHVYFPTDCLVSLLHALRDGASDEIAVVGSEGVVGMAVVTCCSMPSRAVVRRSGHAWRLKAEILRSEFRHTIALQLALLRYAQALLTQTAQMAVCNRHHSVEQQFCRWLLLSLDRLPSNELNMTHEQIANMLGVRREGVTEAAGKLQRAGTIQCSRGRIRVLDRPTLEAGACECYEVIRREWNRLLPQMPRHATAGREGVDRSWPARPLVMASV